MKIDHPRIFEGRSVTIVGGGPSLVGFDYSILQGATIAVNTAAFYFTPDAVVAIDEKWHKENEICVREIASWDVPIFGREENRHKWIIPIQLDRDQAKDDAIYRSNLSGFYAIAAAEYLGAKDIFLLGFDGGYDGEQSNSYKNDRAAESRIYQAANKYYHAFRDSVPIFNFSENSHITTFAKYRIKDYIAFYEKFKYAQIWREQKYDSANALEWANTLVDKFVVRGKCLDIGCGSGITAAQIWKRSQQANLGIEIHGLDITMRAFNAPLLGIERPAWDTGLQNDSYHYTFSTDLMEHIPPQKVGTTIREIGRITKKATIHQIFTRKDRKYSGHEVHLTVQPIEWWREQFRRFCPFMQVEIIET